MIAPEALRDLRQWLLWRLEPNPRKPEGKKLKVPYYINGKRRMGTQGDDKDRGWLTNYHGAVDALSRSRGSRLPFDGVGFAFLPGDGLIGIDLDHMLDESTGELSARALAIVKACGSYTEWSPSKQGLHIFVRGQTTTNKSDKIGVEVFCGAQYFTFTGEHYAGSPTEVNEIPARALKRLHATVDEAKGKERAARRQAAQAPADERAKAESALAVLPPDCGYEEWIQIGMALHALLDDGGFVVWDYWSSKGSKYPGAKDLESHWRSFKPGGGITGATLFKLAKDAGWRPPRGMGSPPRSRGGMGKGDAGSPPPPASEDDDPGDELPPEGMPEIRWRQGFLRQCVDAAEAALMASPDMIYQRAGMPVRVVRRDTANVRNYKRDPGILGFQVVDQAHLVELFTASACWKKWDGRSEEWRRINAPEQAAATYLARAGRWKLKRLWSVISAPTLRPDGTVLQKPGYDEETATWYDPGPVKFPQVPDEPTHEQAQAALATLRKAFASFPFCSPADEAVLLATALTALVRRSMPHAPLVAFTAPTSSAGKTLLADLVSIIATGIRAPAMTYPSNDEEAAKAALSVLMEGDPIVLIDNIERPLEGSWLCTILTSETYRQRVLGRSEMISVPSASLWLATGNNLVLVGDLRTRSLICRIDPQSEHPEQREFADDIKQTIARQRPELVSAGLTVMRAFIATDQRVAEHCGNWGRFEHWTELVRAPLIWLGCEDPCSTIGAIEADDPERGDLLRALYAWRAAFAQEAATVRQAITQANEIMGVRTPPGGLLNDWLQDVAAEKGGGFSAKRAAKWIVRHIGRRVDGMRFVKGKEADHVQTYRVEEVEAAGQRQGKEAGKPEIRG